LLLGVALAACSSGPAASEAETCIAPVNGVVTLTADNRMFNANCLELPAGLAVTIHFTNNDGDSHNLAIYTDGTRSTDLFVGDIVAGGESADYDVPALDAGTWYFECNVHPEMNGTVKVS
jgi:plastocyanin